jgi:hypothetical protein
MSIWRKMVGIRPQGDDTGRSIKQETKEVSMQSVTIMEVQTDAANMRRRNQRLEAASSQAELDALAAEMYAEVESWAKVADALGYANGACARRAGLRHKARTESTV